MTEDELNKELNTAQSNYDTSKAALNAIADGSYEDSELTQLKNDMDTAYEAYKAGLDPEMQQELDTITTNIANVENSITQKEVEITQQNLAISAAETAYNSALTTYQTYDTQLKELESKQNDSNLTDEQKTDLSNKIASAREKKNAAQDNVTATKKTLEEEQAKLTTLNEDLNKLKTGEGGLEELNKKKEEFEKKVAENPDAAQLMSAYNEAKAKYDAKKADLKTKVSSEVQASQDEINKINAAKQNLADQTDVSENLKFNSMGDLFDPNAKLNMQFVKNDGMNYMVIAPDNVDPNEELPVLVFLHGSGEVGGGEGTMKKNFCPGGFMPNWNLNNFRGYIICPVLNSGSWNNSKAEQNLRNVINNFSSTHKVNKDKIAITGASLGGAGTVYMAKHMEDVFCRAAALSAYSSGVKPSDVSIPLIGIYGKSDHKGSINYMTGKNGFSSDVLTVVSGGHCDVPKNAFSMDNDGDNCSDLIQWLFAD